MARTIASQTVSAPPNARLRGRNPGLATGAGHRRSRCPRSGSPLSLRTGASWRPASASPHIRTSGRRSCTTCAISALSRVRANESGLIDPYPAAAAFVACESTSELDPGAPTGRGFLNRSLCLPKLNICISSFAQCLRS